MTTQKTNFTRTVLVLCLFILCACTSRMEAEYKDALSEVEQSHFRIAVSKLEVFTKKYPDDPMAVSAAKEAARISQYEIKDFERTVGFLKFIILKSQDFKDRFQAQDALASIYFENLQNYKGAINEYNRLIEISSSEADKQKYAQMVARSYYYLGNFAQTLNEIDELLKRHTQVLDKFAVLLLKANTYVATKEFKKAIGILDQLQLEFPEKAKAESIPLSIAICYEELEDFKKAIEVLEEAKKTDQNNDYLELRIKRLQERLSNKPGSKGYRK